MSVQIEVVCDRCKAVAEGSITQRGTIRPDVPGWRYVSRDTNLCPPCSDAFEVWRNAGPVEKPQDWRKVAHWFTAPNCRAPQANMVHGYSGDPCCPLCPPLPTTSINITPSVPATVVTDAVKRGIANHPNPRSSA